LNLRVASFIYPGGFVKTRFGRTVGAAVGAVLFVLFFSTVADRVVNPVSAAERTDLSITVTAP
jgi:hypothetical protein